MLVMGRELHSRLDNLLPSETEREIYLLANDFSQKDEPIWVRNYGGLRDPWAQARVQTRQGCRMVTAKGPEGELMRRHLDQVKPRVVVQDSEQVQPRLSAAANRAVGKTAGTDTSDGASTVGPWSLTRARHPPEEKRRLLYRHAPHVPTISVRTHCNHLLPSPSFCPFAFPLQVIILHAQPEINFS